MNRRINEVKDKLCFALAFRLPKRLVYWCSIRLMSHATVGRYSGTVVPELTAVDALKRWDVEGKHAPEP